jgi:hypothetical protein
LFRWSEEQKSRLIESILIELPIPQIFVIENADGVYELIDGLQRISSVLQFMEPELLGLAPFSLDGCDIIPDLNGKRYSDLPLALRLRIKRSAFRTIVIKRQSKSFLRYEMFKRLNTGGALLSPQEIRNCSVRMLGDEGVSFYTFLLDLVANPHFQVTTGTLSQADLEQKGSEELVLRFLAAKNARDLFRGSVRNWLDDYMEAVLLEGAPFDLEVERKEFVETFRLIAEKFGESAFVKFREQAPIGGLAPAYFEAVAIGSFMASSELVAKDADRVKRALVALVQGDEFRKVTGPGANARWKLETRIKLVEECIRTA